MTSAAAPVSDPDRSPFPTAPRLIEGEALSAFAALARLAARQAGCTAALCLVESSRVTVLGTHGAMAALPASHHPCWARAAACSDVPQWCPDAPGADSGWLLLAKDIPPSAALPDAWICVALHQQRGNTPSGQAAVNEALRAGLADLTVVAADLVAAQRGLVMDVAERARDAEKLRVSEELYRCVAATINDGLLVVQLDGRMVAMNSAGGRLLGFAPDTVAAMNGQLPALEFLAEDLETPLDRSAWPWHVVVQTGQQINDQVYALRAANGDIAWVRLSCHLLAVSRDASPFAAVATFRDITQEREAACALARSEERWKFALDGAGHGVWDWALGLSRVYYSPRWKSMLGFEVEEISDHPSELIDRIHPDERSNVVRRFMDYCQTGQGLFQAEFRMRHKSGEFIWILSRGKVVGHESDGRAMRVVGTHSDITPLKLAEKALRDKHSAEVASRAKSEFVSRMSHEIRTPLNAVRGFAQLLAQHPLAAGADEVRGYVDQILHGSAVLGELVNDVLDLQQIESGAFPVAREVVDLPALTRQSFSMLAPLAREAHVQLQDRVPPEATVWGDRRRLQQVLVNLTTNAIKYNRQGGSVSLDVRPGEGGMLALTVEDTGPGMSADQLGRLFHPFERLGKDTSQIEGSGLGLIITRSLVEAMGGRLEIRSQLGEGTHVTVSLPAAEALADKGHDVKTMAAGAATPPAQPPSQADSTGLACTEQAPLRVMYVEDNRINALLFQEALRPYPELLLEVAEDGQAAMALAREQQPEVLVIDAHLPGMTGFEVLRALRTLPGLAQVPAYMCSADALPEDIERAREEGFMGYWTKPIDIEQVTSELHRLARRGHVHRS